MSVIVRGMEMPTNCADCPLNYDQMACAVTGTRWWSDSMVIMNFDSDKERMPNCPLIEVPTPHGDLVDREKLLAEYDRQHVGPLGGARKIMEHATAVIKEEGIK